MTHKTIKRLTGFLAATGAVVAVLLLVIGWARAAGTAATPQTTTAAIGTAFTYQGKLDSGGSPVNGACDMQFSLYDAASGGSQIGATLTKSGVAVSDGFFTTELDFGGGAFDGNARYLQIAVRCAGESSYTELNGRVALNPAPYAAYAAAAPWSGLSGVPAGFADGTDDGQTYARTIVIGPSGTITENGTALLNAINGISGATYTNTYLIKLEPGVYHIADNTLQMKEYVVIEGSGREITNITANGRSAFYSGSVIAADFAELRDLGLSVSGGNFAAALYNNALFTLNNVRISATEAMSFNVGITHEGTGAALTIYDSAIDASGLPFFGGGDTDAYGIDADGGSLEIYRSRVTAVSGSNREAIGIKAGTINPTYLTVKDSQIEAWGNGDNHFGISFYVNSGTAEAKILETEITAASTGLTSVAFRAAASTGVTTSSVIEINNSRLDGGTYSVSNSKHTVQIAATRLKGGLYKDSAVTPPSTYNCIYVYDDSYNAVTCP